MTRRALAASALAAALVFGGASTRAEVVRVGPWTVAPPFGKSEDARTALSGAACATATACLVVNDDKKYAQFFTVDGTTIVPGRVIRLLPDRIGDEPMKQIDAEGAAFVPGPPGSASHYYVAGSHGAARNGEVQASRFFLFRFPVDPTTGLPTFAFDDETAAREIERWDVLRAAIRGHPDLAAAAEKSPETGGLTIEGVAVADGTLVLGLRSPAPDGRAFVLGLPLASAFSPGAAPLSVRRVGLEKGAGIRDLAAVAGGFLILSGQIASAPTPDEPAVSPAVWFWDGRSDEARRLGDLPGATPTDKGETLLVLGEADGGWRVLVLFDGIANGGPVEYRVAR